MLVNSVSGFSLTISFIFVFAASSFAQEFHLSDLEKLEIGTLSDSNNVVTRNGFELTSTLRDEPNVYYWFKSKQTGNRLHILSTSHSDGSQVLSIIYRIINESDYNSILDNSKHNYKYDKASKSHIYKTSSYSDQSYELLGFAIHEEAPSYIFHYMEFKGKELSLPPFDHSLKEIKE